MTFYGDVSMLHAMKEIKKLKTEGERRKWLDDYFGFDESPKGSSFVSRVACLLCQDTGCVMIYHPDVMVAASQGDESIPWHKKVAIRCNCAAGEKMPEQSLQQQRRSKRNEGVEGYLHGKELVFGDERWHIAVNDPDGKAKCSTFEMKTIHEWQP